MLFLRVGPLITPFNHDLIEVTHKGSTSATPNFETLLKCVMWCLFHHQNRYLANTVGCNLTTFVNFFPACLHGGHRGTWGGGGELNGTGGYPENLLHYFYILIMSSTLVP